MQKHLASRPSQLMKLSLFSFTGVCSQEGMGVGFSACITGHMTRGSASRGRGSASKGGVCSQGWGLHQGVWGGSASNGVSAYREGRGLHIGGWTDPPRRN